MIKLLKNARIYAPAPLGVKDVLVVGEKICRIDDHIQGYEGLPEVEVFDLEGRTLVPCFVLSYFFPASKHYDCSAGNCKYSKESCR